MDTKGCDCWWIPLNPLPEKCSKCGMPDLDFLPQRYLLNAGTSSPSEMWLAEMGNFLVRERTRKVLELVAPAQCTFWPTCRQKGGAMTEWHLAVPTHLARTADAKASVPRCPSCGEAMTCHPGSQGECAAEWTGQSDWDILKSVNWASSESLGNKRDVRAWVGTVTPAPKFPFANVAFLEASQDHKWQRQLYGRDLYFSARLAFLLMKNLKLRSLDPLQLEYGTLSTEDNAWVRQQMTLLRAAGLTEAAGGKSSDAAAWFDGYLAKQKPRKAFDVAAVEKGLGVELPQSYKAFCTLAGERRFTNIDGAEGFVTIIRPPTKHNVAGAAGDAAVARKGGDEDAPRAAYPFAETEHGDEFVFDIGRAQADAPVYLFLHETMTYEEYAPNFASCIRRWVEG
jgi:hypothetical protein